MTGPTPLVVSVTSDTVNVLSAAVNYLWGILAVASIVSVMDWWLQRFRFERKIRMTPNELREELRSLRADPKVRWQRNG